MSGSGNFMSYTAGSIQQMSSNNVMQVTTFFSCQHSVISSVAYTTSMAPVQMADGPCSNPECQTAPPTNLPTLVEYSAQESKFVNKIKSELELAGMSGERSLGRFNLAEPQTEVELAEAGCSPELIQALLKCGTSNRSVGVATFLGHRNVLAILKNLETCVETHGLQWQAETLASQAHFLNTGVQTRLAELNSTVKRLTINVYPAPGANFSLLEGITSFEQSWGQNQLATLRSSEKGLSVLALPLTNLNILAAKTSIRTAARTSSQQEEQATAGAAQTNPVTVAGSTASSDFAKASGDIRSLRPKSRLLSRKMAESSLTVDFAKAQAHSGKSHTLLTNPWWAASKE